MSIGTDSPVPPPVATLTMTLLWNWWTDIKTLVAAWQLNSSKFSGPRGKKNLVTAGTLMYFDVCTSMYFVPICCNLLLFVSRWFLQTDVAIWCRDWDDSGRLWMLRSWVLLLASETASWVKLFHTGHQSRFLDFSNWWFQPTYEKWWSESQIGSSSLLGKSICHVLNHQAVLVWSWGLWSSPAWRSPQIFTVENVFLNQALNTKDMDIYCSIIVYYSVQKISQ